MLICVYDIGRKRKVTMNIGTKIKNARTSANLTQEQVAEALDVSRQTVSNWENEKTYPDIVSVIKMSDLYNISLDHLLKEKSMSDYLEESTNTVRSKNKLSMIILLATYLGIWAVSLITFWFFISGTDSMGYSIMFLWVLLPVTTFVISLLIGKNNYMGRWKWFFSIAFGIMYMLAEYATFSTANMISFDKINMPQFDLILIGKIISQVGLVVGTFINYVKSKDRK